MKQVVQVTVFGQQFTLKSDSPPAEVRQVADFVNGKLEEVATGRTVDRLSVAVLTLLNVAGDLLRLQSAAAVQDDAAEERLRTLLERLECSGVEAPLPRL